MSVATRLPTPDAGRGVRKLRTGCTETPEYSPKVYRFRHCCWALALLSAQSASARTPASSKDWRSGWTARYGPRSAEGRRWQTHHWMIACGSDHLMTGCSSSPEGSHPSTPGWIVQRWVRPSWAVRVFSSKASLSRPHQRPTSHSDRARNFLLTPLRPCRMSLTRRPFAATGSPGRSSRGSGLLSGKSGCHSR